MSSFQYEMAYEKSLQNCKIDDKDYHFVEIVRKNKKIVSEKITSFTLNFKTSFIGVFYMIFLRDNDPAFARYV